MNCRQCGRPVNPVDHLFAAPGEVHCSACTQTEVTAELPVLTDLDPPAPAEPKDEKT